MCIKIMPHYTTCGHSATANPDLVISFLDTCNPYAPCSGPDITKREEDHIGTCPSCLGAVPTRKKVFYKHCYYSLTCSHEFDHTITDAERDPTAPDEVLITPEPFRICPDCETKGYGNRPGGTERFPNTPSRMPVAFEGLNRVDIESVDEKVRSQMPAAPKVEDEETSEEENFEDVLAKSQPYKGLYSVPPVKKKGGELSTIASQSANTPRAQPATTTTGSAYGPVPATSFPSATPVVATGRTAPPGYRTLPPNTSGDLGLEEDRERERMPRHPSEFDEEQFGE